MNYKDYFAKNKVKISDKKKLAIQIGNIILDARIKNGISQSSLAKKIGTKQPSIARAENGEVIAGIEFLHNIAKALKLKLVVNFDFSTPKSSSGNKKFEVQLPDVNSEGIKSPYHPELLNYKTESTKTDTCEKIILINNK